MTEHSSNTYGAALNNTQSSKQVLPPKHISEFIPLILKELRRRAPAVVAAAASELKDTRLQLNFENGSSLGLYTVGSSILDTGKLSNSHVQINLSDATAEYILSLDKEPHTLPDMEKIDVLGEPDRILDSWRAFQKLSLRAAGLRFAQILWIEYRSRNELKQTQNTNPPSLEKKQSSANIPAITTVAPDQIIWDGQKGVPWWESPAPIDSDLLETMTSYRQLVAEEVNNFIPNKEPRETLYDLMKDYPNRGGKMLRPILCLTTCRALGGTTDDALRLAVAIELFQNAFLVHDDIEDESDIRRGKPCLHHLHGIGLAINAGDGMNLLAIQAVLSNLDKLGLMRTLSAIGEVTQMCQQTIEGQAIELGWIRHNTYPKNDAEYLNMVTKKTAWYTTMAPCRLGAIAAGHNEQSSLEALGQVFKRVGIAFQIQDDLLNLTADEAYFGKEIAGDLLEGKRTLILTHLLNALSKKELNQVTNWLKTPRKQKDMEVAAQILELIHKYDSIEYAKNIAHQYAAESAKLFDSILDFMDETEDKATLRQVVHYVAIRDI